MKIKNRNVWTISNSNQKIEEMEGKMDTPYTYVHDHSFLRVGTYILIKSNGVKMCPNLSSYKNYMDM